MSEREQEARGATPPGVPRGWVRHPHERMLITPLVAGVGGLLAFFTVVAIVVWLPIHTFDPAPSSDWAPLSSEAHAGRNLFAQNGCSGCHTLAAAGATGKVGPDLDRVVQDAARYAKGQPAATYIRHSIVTPNAFVVPGFPRSTMPQTFGKQLTAQQISALVQFLIQSGGGKKK